MSKAIFTFGRMNPPTKGHEKLINKVKVLARTEKAVPHVFLTHTQDKNKNPIDYKAKIKFAKKAFGRIVVESRSKTIIQVAQELEKDYDSIILVVGSDRINDFKKLLKTYNGRDYKFESIDVVSAGLRDPDSDDISSNISASKMREYAVNDDLISFLKGLPTALSNKSRGKDVFDEVRKGLKISEKDILYIMKEIIKS